MKSPSHHFLFGNADWSLVVRGIPTLMKMASFFRRLSLAAICTALLAQPARAGNQTWTGGNATSGNWSNSDSWNGGNAPGSTSSTTSPDVATFNTAIANTWGNSALNPIVIDSATQNIGGITFSGAAGSYFIGSTSGNALTLSDGGTIQILSGIGAGLVETIQAPLTLAGN